MNPDISVQATTDDAIQSKRSSAAHGYFHDPYLQFMTSKATRRSPLINRGYYCRVAAVRTLLERFFTLFPEGQLVNIGAGLDTTFFCLSDSFPNVTHFEIDFEEVLAKKTMIISRHPELKTKIGPSTATNRDILDTGREFFIQSQRYRMIPCDLRDTGALQKLMVAAGYSSDVPTFFLAECVLVYLEATQSDEVIRWARSAVVAPSCFVSYEQFNPTDAFGQTMMRNLLARGCPLLGLHMYPSIDSQKERYPKLGWDAISLLDMNDVYDTFIDPQEILRIQRLEIFDEIEEWRLIQGHYFVSVAVAGWPSDPVAVSHFFLSLGNVGAKAPPQLSV